MVQGDIVANFSGLTNYHTGAVIDEKSTPDGRARVNLDSGKPAPDIGKRSSQPFQPFGPQPVRPSMHQQRMGTRIGCQNLKNGTRGRITIEDTIDIFLNLREHVSLPD